MKKQYKLGALLLCLALCLVLCLTLTPVTARAAGDVEINETNFPDDEFRYYVSWYIDKNEDGFLSEAEIADVTSIDVSHCDIFLLTGIEYFTNSVDFFESERLYKF